MKRCVPFRLMPLLLLTPTAQAAVTDPQALDPFAYVLVELGLVIAAVIGGHLLARRLALPAILGQLLMGLIVGNLLYWSGLSPLFFVIMHFGDASQLFHEVWATGAPVADAAARLFPPESMQPGATGSRLVGILVGNEGPGFLLIGIALWHFSNLGIAFLLIQVAMGVSIDDLVKSGRQSSILSIGGIVASLGLGWLAVAWLLPDAAWSTRFLLASGLVSTSAGIVLPLLPGLRGTLSSAARTLVGAVLIDDVVAVVLISIAVTQVHSGSQSASVVIPSLLAIALFFGGVFFICRKAPDWELAWLRQFDEYQAKLLIPLGLAFFMAWLASQLHLSSIIGIFGAGLILNSLDLESRYQGRLSIEDLIRPLAQVFAPIFFVLLGMQINLVDFFSLQVLITALLLTVAAVAGKVLGVYLATRHTNGWLMGWALVPRGEVTLIVAALAKGLGLMNDSLYAAFMLMVVATILLGPVMVQRLAGERGPARTLPPQ